jgi:hypothetical protein
MTLRSKPIWRRSRFVSRAQTKSKCCPLGSHWILGSGKGTDPSKRTVTFGSSMLCFIATIALQSQVPVLPAPSGDWAVGTRVQLMRDAKRRDPVDPSMPRELLVQYWYPASRSTGVLAPYVRPSLLDAMRFDRYLDVDIGLLDGWDRIRTHAHLDAPPLQRKTCLVIFSPGFGMSLTSYTTLFEDLASRGVTVAAIDHPFEGLSIYPGGRLLNYTAYRAKPPQRVREIAADQSFVYNQTKAGTPGLPQIDWTRVIAAGHSIGGASALEAGRTDSRFSSLIDLDGDVWGDVEAKGTRRPFLVLNNEPGPPVHIPPRMKKERLDEWKRVLEKSPGPGTEVVIHRTYHFSFSDAPFLLPSSIPAMSGANLDPIAGRKTIVDLMIAFLEGGTKRLRQKVDHSNYAAILLRKG